MVPPAAGAASGGGVRRKDGSFTRFVRRGSPARSAVALSGGRHRWPACRYPIFSDRSSNTSYGVGRWARPNDLERAGVELMRRNGKPMTKPEKPGRVGRALLPAGRADCAGAHLRQAQTDHEGGHPDVGARLDIEDTDWLARRDTGRQGRGRQGRGLPRALLRRLQRLLERGAPLAWRLADFASPLRALALVGMDPLRAARSGVGSPRPRRDGARGRGRCEAVGPAPTLPPRPRARPPSAPTRCRRPGRGGGYGSTG